MSEFAWKPQGQAALLVERLLSQGVDANAEIARLQTELTTRTGTRLVDWIDLFVVPQEQLDLEEAAAAGFRESMAGYLQHWDGLFPDVVVSTEGVSQVVLRVESVADFLAAQGVSHDVAISGAPFAACRRAIVPSSSKVEMVVWERQGLDRREAWTVGSSIEACDPGMLEQVRDSFRRRPRKLEDSEQAFAEASRLIDRAVQAVGRDRACELFFAAEREYWQRRNRAAQIQKARQDALGLGWANHDHHTYRSSREQFHRLIGVLEQLGLQCRERFYAGRDAGWGAQVLEQPVTGVVVFADVDLGPDEVAGDFAHDGLQASDQLGTVGLWCRLHGEAFLQAGMHHLECQFDFDAARSQLAELGIRTMKPFTDLPHLKQAFTAGQVWPVDEHRVAAALSDGLITQTQADEFRARGALGSHLEILERNDGYKGFNQSGISEIIRDTDPRTQH